MLGAYVQIVILLVLIRVIAVTVKKVNNTIKGNKLQGVAVFLIKIHKVHDTEG